MAGEYEVGVFQQVRTERDAATARAERAEAAIQRVRELHAPVVVTPAHPHGFARGDRRICRSCEPEHGGMVDAWPCPTIAALDSTDPPGPILGYKIGDKLYAPEDVVIVRLAPERSDEGQKKPAVDLMAALRASVDRARASRDGRACDPRSDAGLPADGEERK